MNKSNNEFTNIPEEEKDIADVLHTLQPSDRINIFIASLSLISVILVGLTLFEMQQERDASYRPLIVFSPFEERCEWTEYNHILWKRKDADYSEDSPNNGATMDNTIPMTEFVKKDKTGYYSYLKEVNVGLSAATEIDFIWDPENTDRLVRYIQKHASDTSVQKMDFSDDRCHLSINNYVMGFQKENTQSIMYMDAEAETTYTSFFPLQYSVLCSSIMKDYFEEGDEVPPIVLEVKFKDIQNKPYKETIHFNLSMISENEFPYSYGGGNVTYRYNPKLIDIRKEE